MADLNDLNLKTVEANSFEPLPVGEYPAIVTKSEMKPTKDGTGKRLNLTLQILSGKYQNRTVFDGLNVVNKSAQAQQIGRAQLKALCVAVNVPDPKNSEELHGKPFVVKLGIKKDLEGNDRNVVKEYKAKLPAAKPAAAKNMIEEAFEEPAAEPAAAVTTGTKKNPFA